MVTPRMLDHQDMDTFVYVGAWDPVSDNQVPHPEYPQSYHSTSASGAFVRSVFNGSTGLSLTGTRSCKHGTYNIVRAL